MVKPKGHVRIKLCDNNRDTFIATLHNVLLAPDLCDRVFLIIASIIFGTYLFFSNLVLYGALRGEGEKCGYLAT